MKKKGLLKPAFTLIEMLVVIAIIGMLAVVAVMSFSSATRTAKLDIASDMLVSLFKQQQSLTKSGRGVASGAQNDQPLCYGLIIDKTLDPGKQVQSLNVPYYAISKDGHADYCDITDTTKAINYDAMSDVTIKEMKVGNAPSKSIMVFFKPPFAKPMYDSNGSLDTAKGTLKMTITPVNGDGEQYVTFDPVTGIASKQFNVNINAQILN